MIWLILVQVFSFLFPWIIRKQLLSFFLKFKISQGAYIGYSIILARNLRMHEGSFIGHFTFINRIDLCEMEMFSKIGNNNWITGHSVLNNKAYASSPLRKCELKIGMHARVTGHHFFDCNGGIYIGVYTTIAGRNTQILTHSIDLMENVQKADPVSVGDYCFIGTSSIILKNTRIPSYCVLGAGSVLTKEFSDECFLYAGNPAKPVKRLEKQEYQYFARSHGHVS